MAKFQKGHKLAKGGARPGAGRDPNWWKAWAKEAISKQSRLKKIEKALDDEAVCNFVTKEGEEIVTRASFDQQWEIMRYLSEVAFGKPTTPVDVDVSGKINIVEAIKAARTERGLGE